MSCSRKTHDASCPICGAQPPTSEAGYLAELRRHVEREVPEAINALGEIYTEGRLVVKSTKKAAKIFKRGMALGNVDAMTHLGNLYERGDGVKLDKEKAMQLYRMAADRGDADAQSSLGIMLDHHSGDMEDAVRYYKLAVSTSSATTAAWGPVSPKPSACIRWLQTAATYARGPTSRVC